MLSCKGGCRCENDTDYQPCVPEPICYNGCTSSPCAYDIFSKCPLQTQVGGASYITRMWRNCLYGDEGGTWSARRNCNSGFDISDGTVENAECTDGAVVPWNPTCGGNYIGPMKLGCAQAPVSTAEGFTTCTGCTWTAADLATTTPVWELAVGGPPPGGYPPPGPTTGTTAILRAYVPDCSGAASSAAGTMCLLATYGVLATPTDPDPGFNCLGRTSFRMATLGNCPAEYDDLRDRLPRDLCVVASASNWEHPCGNTTEMCDCKDDGCPTLLLDLTVVCDDTIQEDIVFSRNTTGCALEMFGHDLCPHVSWPTATCGVFVESTDRSCDSDDQRGLLFLVWCDGGIWKIRTYCVLATATALTSVTNVDETTLTRTDDCQMLFEPVTIDLTSSDCCDPCPCPACAAPTGVVLNYDITGPGNGSGTVTGGASFCFTSTLSNGDVMSIEYTVADCTVRVGCNAIACSTFNCGSLKTVTVNSCDPFDVTIEFRGGAFSLCGPCGGGIYTVHIYE